MLNPFSLGDFHHYNKAKSVDSILYFSEGMKSSIIGLKYLNQDCVLIISL